jgi:hypothetical protein
MRIDLLRLAHSCLSLVARAWLFPSAGSCCRGLEHALELVVELRQELRLLLPKLFDALLHLGTFGLGLPSFIFKGICTPAYVSLTTYV